MGVVAGYVESRDEFAYAHHEDRSRSVFNRQWYTVTYPGELRVDAGELYQSLSTSILSNDQVDWQALEQAAVGTAGQEFLARLQTLEAVTEAISPPPLSPSEDDQPQLAVGDFVEDRYEIEEFVDRGGMGEVYRATDKLLRVRLALKVIRPAIASNPSALRCFKREVLLARSISHPNVCRIFHLGQDNAKGIAYLTMEFLSGETLRDRVRSRGPLSPDEALPLIRQLAEGLDAAHRAGVLHRDFKSANIMLVPEEDGERAMIMDFGLAKELEPGSIGTNNSHVTTVEQKDGPKIVGTPAYMAPEQVTDGDLSAACDLYAFGVVLFETLTGRLPFVYDTPMKTALAHVVEAPPSPKDFADLNQPWDRTILRLLSKDPSHRFATGVDAVLALQGTGAAAEVAQHSLPAERDVFVGRNEELRYLTSQLERSGDQRTARPLTLKGPGGIGKTRLVQKYGWERLSSWPGGIWFCDLSEARSAEGIAMAVSRSLNVPLGKDDPIVQLGHAIAGHGECLLILDNFEHLVEQAEATLGRWLEGATRASFLVTSRERLALPQETTYEIEPLDPTTQGMELFEVRAQGHRPGFVVDGSNREQVKEVVQSLEGLPLAIELAAARLRMLSLEQLGVRLQDRFRILAGGQKGRHATLRTTLDWSWDLLQPWEQSAIAQVSVFEGGFTLEAAEAVIDLSTYEEDPFVLDVIQLLVDKSWLRVNVALGVPRFEMYTSVQEYASAKLHPEEAKAAKLSKDNGSPGDSTPRTHVEERHGAYFAAMGTEGSIDDLDRHGGVARRAAYQLELNNLVAACRRAIVRMDENTAAAAYIAADAVLRTQGPHVLSVQLGREVLEFVKAPPRCGRILTALAVATRQLGKIEEAYGHNHAALAICRGLDDQRGERDVLVNLGTLQLETGRLREACEHYETALAIDREMGNKGLEGPTIGNLGILHQYQGRIQEAREYYERALAIHRKVGDRRGEGKVRGNLGNHHMDRGRMEEAREHFEAALAIHREMGNASEEGIVLGNLGNLHLGQDRVEQAREHYEAALAIHRGLGNRRSEAIVLGNLGELHQNQGRMEATIEHYETALAIHHEIGHRRGEGFVLKQLGNLQVKLGRREEARRCLDESISIFRDMNDHFTVGRVLCDLGKLELNEGNRSPARTAFTKAETIAKELAVAPESEFAREIEELREALDKAGDSA